MEVFGSDVISSQVCMGPNQTITPLALVPILAEVWAPRVVEFTLGAVQQREWVRDVALVF
jgi:hypothetical protein